MTANTIVQNHRNYPNVLLDDGMSRSDHEVNGWQVE